MVSIRLNDVSIHFPLHTSKINRSLRRKLLEIGTAGRINQRTNSSVIVESLSHIDLVISEGERVGVIGRNGAGKTTLLKTMSGMCDPIGGSLAIDGLCRAMLNLSSGMDPERTGYENIRFMGLLYGLPLPQIKAMVPDIEEFTELGVYLNFPIRVYSAGMQMKLGFAIATAFPPDILLIDEIIGAGDYHFVEKAMARTNRFMAQSRILVLASHSNELIRDMCNRVIVLENGRIAFDGVPDDGIRYYEETPPSQRLTEAG